MPVGCLIKLFLQVPHIVGHNPAPADEGKKNLPTQKKLSMDECLNLWLLGGAETPAFELGGEVRLIEQCASCGCSF